MRKREGGHADDLRGRETEGPTRETDGRLEDEGEERR